MIAILNLLSQFLPIAIGIALLLGMKSISLAKNKVQIQTPDVQQFITEVETKTSGAQRDTASIITDYLIINGKMPIAKGIDLAAYAIENAGIATYATLPDAKGHADRVSTKEMVLILNDARLLPRILAKMDWTSGMLLAYSLNGRLETVDKWT